MGTMEEGAAEAASRYLRMACRRARFGVTISLRGRPVVCGRGKRVREGRKEMESERRNEGVCDEREYYCDSMCMYTYMCVYL